MNWSPSPPEINALDYCLWTFESEACSTPHHNNEALKVKLKRVWGKTVMESVCAAIKLKKVLWCYLQDKYLLC